MKMRLAMIVAAGCTLLTFNLALAQDPQATPSPADHEAHHPATTATPTPATPPTESGSAGMGEMGMPPMMEGMSGMMGMMMQMRAMMDSMTTMPMSGDMMTLMTQMRNMMDTMMGSTDMPAMIGMMMQMRSMMDSMTTMPMSGDMMDMMTQMRSMMDTMMGSMSMNGTPVPGGTMDRSGMDMGGTSVPGHSMDMSGMDMGGHAMQPLSSAGVPVASETVGGQSLEYRLEDGVKVFDLTARPVRWNILDDVQVTAWTYNGTVPGPMIRVTEGDRVRIEFKNELTEPTTVHWHGIEVPNAMDGVPGITQDPVQPGDTFTYEFVAKPAGTFMYHSHFESDVQVSAGLYAPFIIDPATPEATPPDVDVTMMLSEWRVMNGETFPAMPMAGMEPNYFTINGKAFPATETLNVKLGQRIRIRFIGIGQFLHPMHLHGVPFKITATDGYAVPDLIQLTKDTITVAPGERYDIEFVASAPGQWMLHCHILHHTTNDGADPGGLMVVVNVTE